MGKNPSKAFEWFLIPPLFIHEQDSGPYPTTGAVFKSPDRTWLQFLKDIYVKESPCSSTLWNIPKPTCCVVYLPNSPNEHLKESVMVGVSSVANVTMSPRSLIHFWELTVHIYRNYSSIWHVYDICHVFTYMYIPVWTPDLSKHYELLVPCPHVPLWMVMV